MAKVRVPQSLRPPALEFYNCPKHEWDREETGRFRAKAFRIPRPGEFYWTPYARTVFHCDFKTETFGSPRVILEKIK